MNEKKIIAQILNLSIQKKYLKIGYCATEKKTRLRKLAKYLMNTKKNVNVTDHHKQQRD